MGWATVDQIARALTGQSAVVDVQPLRLFTLDNIKDVPLDQTAASWYGFDFQAYYRKLWGL
jgi:hypothetical protein